MRYIASIGFLLIALAVVCFIILNLTYMVHGSLEMFPTSDDQGSTRIFSATALLALLPIGGVSTYLSFKIWPR